MSARNRAEMALSLAGTMRWLTSMPIDALSFLLVWPRSSRSVGFAGDWAGRCLQRRGPRRANEEAHVDGGQLPTVVAADEGERGPDGLEREGIAAQGAVRDLAGGDDSGVAAVAQLDFLQLEMVIGPRALEACQPG